MGRITRADVALLFTFRGSVNRWSDGGLCMAKKAAAKKAAAVRRSMSDEHEAALAEGREIYSEMTSLVHTSPRSGAGAMRFEAAR